MCVVSMVGDHYNEKWRTQPPFTSSSSTTVFDLSSVSRKEFDQLKHDVEEMKELLKRAKAYDEANGEPDCEIDDKMDLLRRVAAAVGIDLDDVIGVKANTPPRQTLVK